MENILFKGWKMHMKLNLSLACGNIGQTIILSDRHEDQFTKLSSKSGRCSHRSNI